MDVISESSDESREGMERHGDRQADRDRERKTDKERESRGNKTVRGSGMGRRGKIGEEKVEWKGCAKRGIMKLKQSIDRLHACNKRHIKQ